MSVVPKVTIAIPTYNRAELLRVSLASALAQEYPDFRVLVLDNASTDHTEEVVRSFDDPRVTYVRSSTNIGLYGNLRRAVRLNPSPYLTILQDDDVLLPGFVRRSADALDAYGQAALSAARAEYFKLQPETTDDPDARVVSDELPDGLVRGHEYLHQIVAGAKWIIHFSAVMLRASMLTAAGGLDVQHSKFTIDLNIYIRLARLFDVVFVPEVLARVGFHPGRDSQDRFISPSGSGVFAVIAEHVDAIAYLLQSPRADDPAYRRWLAERLLHINAARSDYAARLLPDLNLSWEQRQELALAELAEVLPDDGDVVLVDDGAFGVADVQGRRARPFIERDGVFWGPPPDSATAIRELERMRREGARCIAFGWPAFWWLDYYAELREYLTATFPRVLRSSRVTVYDLREPRAERGGAAR